MNKTTKKLCLGFAVLFLVYGCSAHYYSKMCETWLGADETEIIKAWGPPLRSELTRDKHRLIFYRDEWNYGNLVCETWFETNQVGEIIKWSWRGNACRARNRPVGPDKSGVLSK